MANASDGDACSEAVTIQDMNCFVLDSSKGLAGLTKSKNALTVQFIHESVRDFLHKDDGFRELLLETNGKKASLSQDWLKECRLKYMLVDLPAHASPQTLLPNALSVEAKAIRKRLSVDYPFLEYACKYVLHHADEAARDISQEGFIIAFALGDWIPIANALERHEIRRHSDQVTLCCIAAAHNLARLLKTLSSDSAWRRVPTESYHLPVVAAFANGHEQALRSLIGEDNLVLVNDMLSDPGYGKPDQVGRNKDVLTWSDSKANFALSKCLVANLTQHCSLVEPKFDAAWQIRNDFKLAARESSTARLLSVFERMNDPTIIDFKTYREALSSAFRLRNLEAAQLIIDQAHSQRELLNCTLRETLIQNLPEGVAYLLDHGAQFNDPQSVRDGTALCRAVERNQLELIQILLDREINVNAEDEHDRHAILIASDSNHGDITRLLLDAGADINVQGGRFGNVLQAACYRKEGIELVRLLLDRGADVNVQGGHCGNALHAACRYAKIETGRLLLNRGADVNARGGEFGNALQAAAACPYSLNLGVLQLLLDRGAHVNARGGKYGSALQAAQNRPGIRQLLIDHGATE